MKTTAKKTSDAQRILNILAAADKPVSAGTLKNRARMESYDSVPKRIHDLRKQGHNVRTVTRKRPNGARATTYTLA